MSEELKPIYSVGPYVRLLENPGFISQAYKKVNTFLKKNSSYIDNLELDLSNINFTNSLNNFSEYNSNHKYKINIIPAPKNYSWEFKEDKNKEDFDAWSPEEGNEKPLELRPIADVPLDLQVKAMAITMCLAEFFETKQGEIKEDISSILLNDFHSYGNRLDAIWKEVDGEKKAIFHTGSSSIYKEYFEDYKLFLKRPNQVCNYYGNNIPVDKKLYILSLDIEKFYDNIDMPILFRKIKKAMKKTFETDNFELNQFIKRMKSVLNWEYNMDYEKFVEIKNGLPQGLAASGFFGNIYLLDFDKKVSEIINKDFKNILTDFNKNKITYNNQIYDLKIRDYCRYVDDLRIVIEASSEIDEEKMKSQINELINKLLILDIKNSFNNNNDKEKNTSKALFVNEFKTNIIDYNNAPKPMSQILNSYRNLASGLPSIEDIETNLDSLKNLFLLSMNESKEKKNGLALSNINYKGSDIKLSTVKKFVTTEFKKRIKAKESITVKKEWIKNEKEIKEWNILQNDKIFISKMLIEAWSKDPALIYLLKTAFDINPSAFLLKQVLELLKLKILNNEKNDIKIKKEVFIAYYSLYHLLLQGISFVKNECGDEDRDKKDYQECLLNFVIIIVRSGKIGEIPYYLKQSIILFSICMNRNILLESSNVYCSLLENDETKISKYINFLKIAFMYGSAEEIDDKFRLTLGLLSYQTLWKKERFISWINDFFENITNKRMLNELYEILFLEDKEIFGEYFIKNRNKVNSKYYELFYKAFYQNDKDLNLINNESVSLLRIIYSNHNPFNQENALLLLTKSLLKTQKEVLKKDISIVQISVKCKDWSEIQNPNKYKLDDFFEVDIQSMEKQNLISFEKLPFWFETNKNVFLEKHKLFFNIGKIIRSCLISDINYTRYKYSINYNIKRYRGFKNNSYIRQIGISNIYSELIRKQHPVTQFMKDFLSYCLRWPYSYHTIELDALYKDPIKIINKQIDYQCKFYCELSKLPLYVYDCNSPYVNNRKKLRVAIVQTLFPNTKDFDSKNPLYWSEESKSKHTRHLNDLIEILKKQLRAQNMLKKNEEESVDLIVFPELSINPNDIYLLKRLSNNLKANIFAGLTFEEHPYKKNTVINRAVWLMRQEGLNGDETVEIYQGKMNMTKNEKKWGIEGYRPYQVAINFKMKDNLNWIVSGTICYDSTDLKLAADLRDKTDGFIVAAMNKDVQTFDNMATALSYHMYQPIILVNTGEFGGSTIQAPYSGHNKLIAHLHGNNQIGISIFEIDTEEFKKIEDEVEKIKVKTPPAGYLGRN